MELPPHHVILCRPGQLQAFIARLGHEARVHKAQNDVQVGVSNAVFWQWISFVLGVIQVGQLERALKERNAIETDRRRAESKLKVLETQRDVDFQTLQELQNEITGLRLQLSAKVAAAEELQEQTQLLKQSMVSTPNDKDSGTSAVWQKARAFEERIREKQEAREVSSPKMTPQDCKEHAKDAKETEAGVPSVQARESRESREVGKPRSPNSQMREKLAKVRFSGFG